MSTEQVQHERPSRPAAFYFTCPGCGGSYGRGKGPHGLARHACVGSLRSQIGAAAMAIDSAILDAERLGAQLATEDASAPCRRQLPQTSQSSTIRFEIGGHHGYLIVGEYEDGQPGELFALIAKEGSTLRGLLDGWCRLFSVALQYGVPLRDLCEKFRGAAFDPAGITDVDGIETASSVLDLIVRVLERRYLGEAEQ